MKSRFALIASVVLSIFWMTETTHAYIDPGSGSLFLQILFGGVAGAVVLAKVYWTSFREKMGFPVRSTEGTDDHQAR